MRAAIRSVVAACFLCLTCGHSNSCGSSVTPLIHRGRPVLRGEFPWLAALYMKDKSDRWEQVCGGTLISHQLVLTAAHCLVLFDGNVGPEKIKIGLGKLDRDFYKNEDFSIMINVSHVAVPQNYLGTVSNFALDVAVLKLSAPVKMNDYIAPACINWEDTNNVTSGATVHVAGWGKSENGTLTDTAYAAEMTYLAFPECLLNVRPAYRKYVTHDKICSQSVSGSQVDRGDSGGGLTVVKEGRHFVIGIVSTKVVDQTAFSIFTDVSNPEVQLWLKKQKSLLEESDYMEEFLLVSTNSHTVSRVSLGSTFSDSTPVQLHLDSWPEGPVVDCTTDLMYWVTPDGVAKSARLDGTNIRDFPSKDSLYLPYLTLDWIGRRLYWIEGDNETRRIETADLQTGQTETVTSLPGNMEYLVVHPSLRKLYWINNGTTVENSNLDGTARSKFHSKANTKHYCLAIDWATNDLCWFSHVEPWSYSIKCKNLLSGLKKTVFSNFKTIPWRFTITQHNYYWTTTKNKIYRLSRSSATLETVTLDSLNGWIWGISVVSETCPHFTPAT